jgi:general secretion pathway protein D
VKAPFVLLLALLANIALAAPTPLTAASSGDTLTLAASSVLRYTVDYDSSLLTVLNATAANPEGYPSWARAEQRGEDLRVFVQGAFTVSSSPNGRTLTVTRVPPAPLETPSTPGTTPTNPSSGDGSSSSSGGEGSSTATVFPLIIPLANADPTFVAGILTRSYNIRVEVDPRQRAIIVFVRPEDWAFVRGVVAALDKPAPQVTFEAEILEVNQFLTQSLGFDYRELFSFNLTEASPVPAVLELGEIARAPFSLKIGIDLLKTTGAATTLARPRVTTLDGVEARLNATQTTPIPSPGPNGTVIINNVTTGITLRLLPRVQPDLTGVEAQLSIAVSSPTGQVNNVPQYSTREANTTVRVRNGEPIVIGGLYQNNDSTSSRGLPGLMDLPILGELFKTTTTDKRTTDLVMVVTPYIIAPSSVPVPVAPVAPRGEP